MFRNLLQDIYSLNTPRLEGVHEMAAGPKKEIALFGYSFFILTMDTFINSVNYIIKLTIIVPIPTYRATWPMAAPILSCS